MTQSTLSAHGPAAAEIAGLSWVLFVAGAAIFVVVLAAAAFAVWGRAPAREWLARERIVVGAGILFPVAALSLLLAYVYVIGNRLHAEPVPALRIEVTGEQWWWRVHYLDARRAARLRDRERDPHSGGPRRSSSRCARPT